MSAPIAQHTPSDWRAVRLEILKGFISENRCRLREDWQTVESKRIARQNITDSENEIKQLEAADETK